MITIRDTFSPESNHASHVTTFGPKSKQVPHDGEPRITSEQEFCFGEGVPFWRIYHSRLDLSAKREKIQGAVLDESQACQGDCDCLKQGLL